MRASPEDQSAQVPAGRRFPSVAVIVVVALLVGLLFSGLWRGQTTPEEGVTTQPGSIPLPSEVTGDLQPAPDIPVKPATLVPQEIPESDEQAPSSPVASGDELLHEELKLVGFDALLMQFVSDQHPLDVSAALLDGISRGSLLRKILPANPPAAPFGVELEGGVAYMSSASYKRYDVYADSIASLDVALIAQAFHRLRGVYETAYEGIGLDPGDFDNAVIRALNIVLSTPVINEPVALERKSVMYRYADPELEKLPPVQKQLLRTGPENILRIKKVARSLRDRLLVGSGGV
jgi:hypothetical protein